jgi:hypothetical protein
MPDKVGSLDEEFSLWLGRLAVGWAIPIENVPLHFAKKEISNRINCYPAFGAAVTQDPIDITVVENAGKQCWALGERFDAIRFSKFSTNVNTADVIKDLVANLPSDDDGVSKCIDTFMASCESLGYRNPQTQNLNASSAGLLASTILTAAFPTRFVDFRQTRWNDLADELNYPLDFKDRPSYGEMIVAAGRFAQEIVATKTFQEYWPDEEPLWTIAGICWHANSGPGAERPEGAPVFPYEEDFEEGAMVLRSHRIRERNNSVVRKAKDLWQVTDPQLHCDVCGFSFMEAYGELGEGFIEAHHIKPVKALKAGARTRVSDLAKVCANCHQMIHKGNECLGIEELRGRLLSD